MILIFGVNEVISVRMEMSTIMVSLTEGVFESSEAKLDGVVEDIFDIGAQLSE